MSRLVSPRTALALAALTLSSGLFQTAARAQGAPRQASAQAVFEDAKKLMAKKDYAAACPKFADSQQLDPAPGTQFNLADCYEKAGQTASAWATFKSAAASYRAHNRPDWETKARDRAAALESKLSKLTINVGAQGAVTGLEVTRDGVPVVSSERGSAIPVDPGAHTIEATAPGKLKWTKSVAVAANGDQQTVTLPPFANDPSAASVPPPVAVNSKPSSAMAPEMPPKQAGSGQKTMGVVLVGVGAAGVIVGSVTGLMAISKNKTSTSACPNDGACTSQDAIDANKSASTLGTVSTVGFIVGGVALAAGGVLFLTAPKASEARSTGRVRIAPTAGPGSLGLVMGGAW